MLEPPDGVAERILVVDDDQHVRRLLERLLARRGFSCAGAESAQRARECLAEEKYALVLCDVNMPGESGLGAVKSILADHPGTAAVMVSGEDDPAIANAAFEAGAYGYILKPFRESDVLITVANALRRRTLEAENLGYRQRLEETVRHRTAALEKALANMERAADELRLSREETIRRLARAVETRDDDTGGHIERVSRICGLLAERLNIDPRAIRLASPLHDAGKIAVPDHILLKPGRLTPEERREMERHAEVGYRLLSGSGSTLLELAALIAWTHHERWDGGGYPRGLAGDEIPIEGQIASVADVFDALTSDRVYRPAFSVEQAVAMMVGERGVQFNPLLLDLLTECVDDVVEIRLEVGSDTAEPEDEDALQRLTA